MTRLLKSLTSPSGLLCVFVILSGFTAGTYIAAGVDQPSGFTLIYLFGFLWIIGWWLRADSKKRGIGWVYDLGFFLSIAWPFIIPYYLVKTRRLKGLLLLLGFFTVYVVASLVGSVMYTVLAPEHSPHAIGLSEIN